MHVILLPYNYNIFSCALRKDTSYNVSTVDYLVSQFYWSNLASWHLPEHIKDVLLIFITVLHYLHVT